MKPASIKTKLQMAALLIVGGFGLGAYQFYEFLTTERKTLQTNREIASQELERQRGELAKVKGFAENIQNVKQEFRELNLQLESVMEYLPKNNNLASLLRKMTMVAENSGVQIIGFKPATEEKAVGFYSESRIDLSLKGGFGQNLVFFDQLARLKRIVNIESIKMTFIAPAGQASSSGGALDTLVSLQTYRLTE